MPAVKVHRYNAVYRNAQHMNIGGNKYNLIYGSIPIIFAVEPIYSDILYQKRDSTDAFNKSKCVSAYIFSINTILAFEAMRSNRLSAAFHQRHNDETYQYLPKESEN
jgi:hypothetical protein